MKVNVVTTTMAAVLAASIPISHAHLENVISSHNHAISEIQTALANSNVVDVKEPAKLYEPVGTAACASLCVDESKVPNNYRNVTLSVDGADITCGKLEETFPLISTDPGKCHELHTTGFINCGCPTPDNTRCSPCPGDKTIMDPNLIMLKANTTDPDVTCGEAATSLIEFGSQSSINCEYVQGLLASSCGCSVAPKPSTCTLCADGSSVSNVYKDKLFGDDSSSVTCGTMEQYMMLIPENMCPNTQLAAFMYCGCPTGPKPLADSCELCDGGAVNVDYSISDFDGRFTCGDFVEPFKGIPASSETCSAIQVESYEHGCCKQSKESCTLCGDGSPVSVDYKDNLVGEDGEGTTTCAMIEQYALTVPDKDCPSTQMAGFMYCGCPTGPKPVEVSCEPCPEGYAGNMEHPFPGLGNQFKCGDFVEPFKGIPESDDMCGVYQSIGVQNGCCTQSKGSCTLCSDGSPVSVDYKDKLFGEDGEDTSTCAIIEQHALMIPDKDCPSVQMAGFMYCGCPTGPKPVEGSCTLCGDGSPVSVDYKDTLLGEDGEDTSTCAMMEQHALMIPDKECPSVQFSGFMYCGCPTGPKPVEDPCKLCPEGYSVNEEHTVSELDDRFTCGDFVEPFKGISASSEMCDEMKIESYKAGCCKGKYWDRCPDDNSALFRIERWSKDKPCSWLNTLWGKQREKYCSEEFSNAKEICPFTCQGMCSCRDKPWKKFKDNKGNNKNCKRLSRFGEQNIINICKWNKKARQRCRDTCAGWCTFE